MKKEGAVVKSKYVLITNLSYVIIGDVRTDTHALLLEEWEEQLGGKYARRRVRGFGTDATWPVFDLHVSSVGYELTVKGKGHVILQIDNGPRLDLSVSDQDRPIDVLTFAPGTDIEEVWEALPWKVASYWWPSYTNMPRLVWLLPRRW